MNDLVKLNSYQSERSYIRTKCRACHSDNLTQILFFDNMPLAGGFLSELKDSETELKFPLPIHICEKCSLVQILVVIDPELLFQNYSFSSSTIAPLVSHFKEYANWINEKFKPKSVLEFGCNDGVLLKPLEELGVKSVGIDVSKNISEMARSKGLNVETGYFNVKFAEQILEKYGKFDLATGSNVFAHNDKPDDILEAMKKVLNQDGVLCLEFMYIGDLWETCQWDTLYHEHLTFYSLHTIKVLLEKHGFHIIEAVRLPMHGGSLRVSAGLSSKHEVSPNVAKILDYELEKQFTKIETWLKFSELVNRKIEVVRDTLSVVSKNATICGYGAAGKATMWVNACNMDYLSYMVDASPLRAGKFMPGTHTAIVLPEKFHNEPPDYVFVTAWNYAELIKEKENWFKGQWITPLPDLRFF